MNKTILASALFITIFVSSLGRAELIIYKGTEKEVISNQ